MKTTIALPLLALALAACEPYPTAPGYPALSAGSARLSALSYPDRRCRLAATEPYPRPGYPQPGYPQPGYPQPGYPAGEATLSRDRHRAFLGPGDRPRPDLHRPRQQRQRVTTRRRRRSTAPPGEIYRTQRLEVNIVHRQCSDGMSDRSYPDTVDVRVDGRQRYRGCGAPIEYFNQTRRDRAAKLSKKVRISQITRGSVVRPQLSGHWQLPYGQPAYPGPGSPYGQPGYGGARSARQPVIKLGGTNWRVLRSTARALRPTISTSTSCPDQIGAKFGCNSMGASYSTGRQTLTAGAIMATRMACPDMASRARDRQVLARPMTIAGFGQRVNLSNGRADNRAGPGALRPRPRRHPRLHSAAAAPCRRHSEPTPRPATRLQSRVRSARY